MVRVNLSGADSDFEALPSGKYLVKVTDGELKESGPNAKHPGSEYINWEFTIQQGDFEDRKVWSNTVVSHGDCDCGEEDKFNKALSNIAQLLKVTGVASDDDLESEDFELEIDDVIGTDLVVTVTQREYDDEMRNDIKKYRPAGDLAGAEASLLP